MFSHITTQFSRFESCDLLQIGPAFVYNSSDCMDVYIYETCIHPVMSSHSCKSVIWFRCTITQFFMHQMSVSSAHACVCVSLITGVCLILVLPICLVHFAPFSIIFCYFLHLSGCCVFLLLTLRHLMGTQSTNPPYSSSICLKQETRKLKYHLLS